MTDVLGNIKENASLLKDEAKPSDDLGRLTDRTASILRESGVIRMYQPREWGGFEAHPVEFMEAAMAVGAASPSAGWVTGVRIAAPGAPLLKLDDLFRKAGQWIGF